MKNKKQKIAKLKIEIVKQKIETEKIALDRYVKTIVRSCFIDCCNGGAYFNNLFHDLLKDGSDKIMDSKKSKEEKEKIRAEWFPLFGKVQTDLEGWESILKYHERLTSWAKFFLGNLNDENKEKIIRDCINQKELWSSQFDIN